MRLGKWEAQRVAFASGRVPTFAAISGGRTSGMMAALCDERTTLLFANTGREHPTTYEFLVELEHGLGRPIVWLEFRPPSPGARPASASFAVVTPTTAAYDGAPFRAMLKMLADYRATKGLGPISPWARARLCTGFLKHRVMDHYIQGLIGTEAQERLVGLRADEPKRVAGLRARETQRCAFRTPLADVGITVSDVSAFWATQDFDLRLEPHQGNCTACFLKDQSDLARVLNEPETDAGWWESVAGDYPNFGGQRFPGYRQLRMEGPGRLAIESELRAGRKPLPIAGWVPRRFDLVVRQERARLAGEIAREPCACEATFGVGLEEDEA